MKPIIAIQGASTIVIQGLMADCVRRWSRSGVRIVGLIETCREGADPASKPGLLRDIVTGTTYPIYQDLGTGSTACRLTAAGVIDACASLCAQITRGCDLVVLSKFGKLEAGRSGLIDAFARAVETGTPILTAVSPLFGTEWDAFSRPLAALVPPSPVVLDDWWRACRRTRLAA